MNAEVNVLNLLESHGDAVAYRDATTQVSYRELARRVRQQAANLSRRGVTPGMRIAFAPANDLETLIWFWSLFEANAIACPLSRRFPSEVREATCDRLHATWWGPSDAAPQLRRRNEAEEESAGTILLSSGSTGVPKAIVHALPAHFASARASETMIPLDAHSRWLWALPPNHVSGLSILIRCANAGATVTQASETRNARTFQELGVTHLSLVPTQLRRLLQDEFPTPSLQRVLLGGSAMPRGLLREAIDRGVSLHVSYGMTEFASQIATSDVLHDEEAVAATILPHCDVRIGDAGEIMIRGDALCRGYATPSGVVPVVDHDGWFRTGDRGKLTDGQLQVLGRLDNMFISGGENIYPEAIEAALMSREEIELAVVVPRHDTEFGARPVAFVRSSHWDETAWRENLGARLQSFEVPVAFLPLEDVPGELKPSRAYLQEKLN